MKRLWVVMTVVFVSLLANGAQAGKISGTVSYDGEVPKFRPISMEADPICLTKHEDPVYPQTLELGENKTMANIFVYVKEGVPPKDYEAPQEPAVISQHGCQYKPHVMGVMTGQPVKILNPDGTLHNVHALPKNNPEFNLAMPKFRKEVKKTFENAEFMFPIKCDVHPWMGAWISVMEHPFFKVTGKDGQYVIEGLPPGEYTIAAWHEKLGEQVQNVTVSDSDVEGVDFIFSRPGK